MPPVVQNCQHHGSVYHHCMWLSEIHKRFPKVDTAIVAPENDSLSCAMLKTLSFLDIVDIYFHLQLLSYNF